MQVVKVVMKYRRSVVVCLVVLGKVCRVGQVCQSARRFVGED